MKDNKITIYDALTLAVGHLTHVSVSGYDNMQHMVAALELITKCTESMASNKTSSESDEPTSEEPTE